MVLRLLSSTALAGALVCSPALARDDREVAGRPGNVTEAEPAIADIVVTAERRSVSIQDIPIAISAFDAGRLRDAGVSDAAALNKLVSGLDLRGNDGPGGLAIFIRGVGAAPKNGLADQANSFNVDGVSFSRPVGPDSSFFDIERIEVLKGPQGTLYGRNATAGAVNVITRQPRLGEVNGFGRMTLGNYGTYQAEAGINVPVGSTVAARLSGNIVGRNGYYRDGYGDQDTMAGRLHIYFEPSPVVNLLVTASGSRERGQGPGAIPMGPNPSAGLTGNFVGRAWDGPSSAAIDGYVRSLGQFSNPAASGPDANGRVHNDIWSVAGTLNVDVGPATWTTIAGYRDIKSDNIGYVTFTGLYTRFRTKEFTAETRLSSNGSGPLKWIIGAFYGKEDMSNLAWGENISGQAPAHPPFPPSTDPDYIFLNLPSVKNSSWAVFGQGTYALTDRFRATGGLRYTRDRKTLGNGSFGFVDAPYDTQPFSDLVFPGGVIHGAFVPVHNAKTFDAVTFSAGLEFDAAKDSLVYANVRKGYHAGGLIASDDVGPYKTTYAPETLMAYSLGTKNRFFGNALTINLEAYYWDYKNLQIETIGLVNCSTCTATPLTPAGATFGQIYDNAGKAHTYGLDADVIWKMTSRDEFRLNMLVARGKYDRYTISSPFGSVVADGQDLAGLPKLSFTADYQHSVPLGNGGTVVLAGRTRFVGKRDFGASPYPGSTRKAYTSSELELTYQAPDGHFRGTAFVRNIENGKNFVSAASTIPDPVTGSGWGTLAPPRTYGLTLSANF